jgi:hypothetical protein
MINKRHKIPGCTGRPNNEQNNMPKAVSVGPAQTRKRGIRCGSQAPMKVIAAKGSEKNK